MAVPNWIQMTLPHMASQLRNLCTLVDEVEVAPRNRPEFGPARVLVC